LGFFFTKFTNVHLRHSGLSWNNQYSSTSVFVSDSGGPLIDTWSTPPKLDPLLWKTAPTHLNANEKRVLTLGAERFVTGLALQSVPLSARSSPGGPDIKHATIYSGLGKLVMRLRPPANDTRHIGMTLIFSAVLQKQLVLVVEDVSGGKAVSFPFRSIKAGARQPVFCGDHTNGPAMAHGVSTLPVISWTVPMPDAQVGWT
jgi:hypothetical protein